MGRESASCEEDEVEKEIHSFVVEDKGHSRVNFKHIERK